MQTWYVGSFSLIEEFARFRLGAFNTHRNRYPTTLPPTTQEGKEPSYFFLWVVVLTRGLSFL